MTTKVVTPRFNRSELRILVILFSAMTIVATGIQMGNALFPSLSRLMNVPTSTVTLLVSVWAFTGLLSPLFGPPSDRYGHGIFVLIGLLSFTIGNLLCAFAPTFQFLLVFQILVGLGYAIYSFSSSAVVGDVFSYEMRARAMGIIRIAVSVTALVGVPSAVAIAGWGTARISYGAVGVLCALVLLFAWRFIPKSSHSKTAIQKQQGTTRFWTSLKEITRNKSAMIGLSLYIIWPMVPMGILIYLAAWLEHTYSLTEMQIGLAFSLAGVGGLIGNTLTALWADRIGKKRSSLTGMLILSIAVILMPRSGILFSAMTCFVIFVAALEFLAAAFGTWMTELAPTNRGTLMSLVSLASGISTGLAPLLMRPLWETGGYLLVTSVLGGLGLILAIVIGLLMIEPSAQLAKVSNPGGAIEET